MAYAPTTTDRSAEYIFGAMQADQDRALREQALQQQQMQQFQQTGMQAIGMIADQQNQAAKTKEEMDMLDGKMEYFRTSSPDGSRPFVDEDTFNSYLTSSIGKKRAMVNIGESAYNQYLKSLPPAVNKIPWTNYASVNGQIVPMAGPPKPPERQLKMAADGTYVAIDPMTGLDPQGRPVQAPAKSQSAYAPVLNAIFGGPSTPSASTPEPPMQTASPAAVDPGLPGEYDSAKAVKAAYRAGKIDQATARDILRRKFGVQ